MHGTWATPHFEVEIGARALERPRLACERESSQLGVRAGGRGWIRFESVPEVHAIVCGLAVGVVRERGSDAPHQERRVGFAAAFETLEPVARLEIELVEA